MPYLIGHCFLIGLYMSLTCPSCKKGKLIPSFLDELFRCYTCDDCGGSLIYLTDYLHWLERDSSEPGPKEPLIEKDINDSKSTMVCPVTGHMMLKYHISNETSHRLDLSPSISAMWLDKDEWDLIKKENLSRYLNNIFTEPWQRKVKSNCSTETFAEMYQEKFGESDYIKLKDIRAWLESSDNKQVMMAYLLTDDPYKA